MHQSSQAPAKVVWGEIVPQLFAVPPHKLMDRIAAHAARNELMVPGPRALQVPEAIRNRRRLLSADRVLCNGFFLRPQTHGHLPSRSTPPDGIQVNSPVN